MDGLGIFVCTGCDIGTAVKVDDFEALAKENGATVYGCDSCLCSDEATAMLRQKVDAGEVTRMVLAACSPRAKVDEFYFDPTKVAVERVSLREQVAWSQPPLEEDTQFLAEDLLRMGLARAERRTFPEPLQETIDRTVLVVGGGVAGMQAALASANIGNPVVLVESQDHLGGYLSQMKDVPPDCPPYTEPHSNATQDLIQQVQDHSAIRVMLDSKTKEISGQPGQFTVQIETSSGEAQTCTAGVIVQATGASPYDARKLTHLGYGQIPDVVTAQELEAMLADSKLTLPSGKGDPKRVVIVQCAGSRDPEHLPYCSGECCGATLKQVAVIHREFPEVECVVVYRDMRTPGQLEHFYEAVQEQENTLFLRGVVGAVADGSPMTVTVSDTMLGEDVTLDADLVVLAVGMVPNSADGSAIRELKDAQMRVLKNESETQVLEANKLIETLKQHENTEILNLTYRQGPDLPALAYGFPDFTSSK